MKILAIGAHPDDLETFCGGTLTRYADEGHEVVMCTATNGAMGVSPDADPVEAGKLRLKECEEAAAIIGAKAATIGFTGPHILREDDPQLRTINLIRREAPQVVIPHASNDYHVNHRETATLVADAIYSCRSVGIRTEAPLLNELPALYLMDNVAAIGFSPTDYVDITDQMEVKLQMLQVHASQTQRMNSQEGVDLTDLCRTQSRLRGIQCGVRYAEAFIRADRWHLNKPARFLP